ncbi:probable disease resistance protein [Tanacetum coccineum]
MAEAVLIGGVVGAGLEEILSQLTKVIIHVIKKTSQFKSILLEIQETLTRLRPHFHDIHKLIEQLDRPQEEKDAFIAQIKGAEAIVRECEQVKWNYYKTYRHTRKLDKLKASLLRFCQIDVQLQQARDVKEALVILKDLQQRAADKDVEKRMERGIKRSRGKKRALAKQILKVLLDRGTDKEKVMAMFLMYHELKDRWRSKHCMITRA